MAGVTMRITSQPEAPFQLSGTARIGAVELIVSDLGRSLDFYTGVIGLNVLAQDESSAQLGVAAESRVLFELKQRLGVRPLTTKRLGLYHTALLLPSRGDLASFAEHLRQRGVRAAASDHLISEAFYLDDPDGLNIEIYADRDRSLWPWEGQELAVAILPLNISALLATPHHPWAGVPLGTSIGHVHFYIGDLQVAERLYLQGLGMAVQTRGLPGALFVAAGDYHHHVGLNTWAGAVPTASEGDPRLSRWDLQVPHDQVLSLRQRMVEAGWQLAADQTLVDPWGIRVQLIGLPQ